MKYYHAYNAENHYSMSYKRLEYWAKRHKQAVHNNETEMIEWIEGMLTDINFHTECALFQKGQYGKALKTFRGE